MLRIQYLDKDRFMQQVAASRGSVLLHLANGETCDLKKDNAATELFQMMDAPSKGFDISVTDPADVTGFLHCLRPAAEIAPPADPSTFSFFRILQQCKTPAPGSEAGTGVLRFPFFCYRMHRLMARATASSSSCPMKPNFASCSSAKQTVSSEVCSGSPKPAVLMP